MTEAPTPDRMVRSNFVRAGDTPEDPYLDPCDPPQGVHWVYARAPDDNQTFAYVGKWLVRCGCQYIPSSWALVRDGTIGGRLGIAAKVSTHWHHDHDPASAHWRDHVICIYTGDYRDEVDVLRVAQGLRDLGVVAKMTLLYKPDAMTYLGMYKENASGQISIYSCPPPYDQLRVNEKNRSSLDVGSRLGRRQAD